MGSFMIKKIKGKDTDDLSRAIDGNISLPPDTLKQPDGSSLELTARKENVKLVVKDGNVYVLRNGSAARYIAGYGTYLRRGDKIRIPGFGTYLVRYED